MLTCDVCLKEFAHTSVYSSALYAASFSFCEDCARLGLEPYGAIVYTMWMLDGKVENSSDPEWLEWMVAEVLSHLNKTWDDLNKDVKDFKDFKESLNAEEEKARKAEEEEDKSKFEDFEADLL